ncbi:MAG: bifunctional UDP-N-acetylglucosamine diphosphorylase/glucosamine-1-phosphate N-acetyltransferase GlmU [Elsteraceae bacterium]
MISPDESNQSAATPPLAAIILAAGMGTRMRSALPKVMHKVAGRPMLAHVLAGLATLKPQRQVVVVGPGMENVATLAAPVPTAVQTDRRGTAHAVLAAMPAIGAFDGTILVTVGDAPLLRPETYARLVKARADSDAGIAVLAFNAADPTGYGRMVRDAAGDLLKIVEHAEADAATRALTLCNGGVMAFDGAALPGWLAQIQPNNAKGEFYLTDAVGLAARDGRRMVIVEAEEEELMGLDDRVDLAAGEAVMQGRLRRAAMVAGATLVDPASIFFSWDTKIGRDVVIGPHVVFGPGVSVADGAEIKSFSHLEGCEVGPGAIVGPFARLRPGAVLEQDVHVGNFVEVKNTRIEAGAKANHLTYLGDARVGARANIGAGTITCNYDGFSKFHTDIGAGAFIGSNSALVAPIRIGDGAIVAAGSTLTHDVPADAVAFGRARQSERPGVAAAFRASRKKKKD